MPKTATILDKLSKALKAREHAMNRFDRRTVFNIPKDDAFDLRARREAGDLLDRLDDRSILEFRRVMQSPRGEVRREAVRMMPSSLLDELPEGW